MAYKLGIEQGVRLYTSRISLDSCPGIPLASNMMPHIKANSTTVYDYRFSADFIVGLNDY